MFRDSHRVDNVFWLARLFITRFLRHDRYVLFLFTIRWSWRFSFLIPRLLLRCIQTRYTTQRYDTNCLTIFSSLSFLSSLRHQIPTTAERLSGNESQPSFMILRSSCVYGKRDMNGGWWRGRTCFCGMKVREEFVVAFFPFLFLNVPKWMHFNEGEQNNGMTSTVCSEWRTEIKIAFQINICAYFIKSQLQTRKQDDCHLYCKQ